MKRNVSIEAAATKIIWRNGPFAYRMSLVIYYHEHPAYRRINIEGKDVVVTCCSVTGNILTGRYEKAM